MKKRKPNIPDRAGKKESVGDLGSIEELLKDHSEWEPSRAVYEPSEDAMARLSVIPLLFDEPRNPTVNTGSLVYASWAQGPPVALRDVTDGFVRRIQLKAGKVSLEIVAEMSKGRWEFVARVYRGRSVVHDFVMNVGRKKILSESGGYYRWSSKTVPHKIGLTSIGKRLTFERLSW